MGRFRDHRDWNGEWDGFYDGRRSSMRVSTLLESGTSSRFFWSASFVDSDSNHWGNVPDVGQTFDAGAHEVEGFRLEPIGGGPPGRGTIEWPRVHIHTWDTNIVSGISHWRGKDFGMWYRRRGSGQLPASPGRRFTTLYNLTGAGDHPQGQVVNFRGSYDGRAALISLVLIVRSNPDHEVDIRVETVQNGVRWRSGQRAWPIRQHWLEDLELQPSNAPPGTESMRWPRLFIHTWDCAQISGWSEWHGSRYGLSASSV